jgi:hypothetical protein
MSDFRNPNDPLWRDTSYDSGTPSYGSAGAWIAGAAVVVVVLLIAFGVRHEPSQIASNDIAPPAATRMAPPPATVPPGESGAWSGASSYSRPARNQ